MLIEQTIFLSHSIDVDVVPGAYSHDLETSHNFLYLCDHASDLVLPYMPIKTPIVKTSELSYGLYNNSFFPTESNISIARRPQSKVLLRYMKWLKKLAIFYDIELPVFYYYDVDYNPIVINIDGPEDQLVGRIWDHNNIYNQIHKYILEKLPPKFVRTFWGMLHLDERNFIYYSRKETSLSSSSPTLEWKMNSLKDLGLTDYTNFGGFLFKEDNSFYEMEGKSGQPDLKPYVKNFPNNKLQLVNTIPTLVLQATYGTSAYYFDPDAPTDGGGPYSTNLNQYTNEIGDYLGIDSFNELIDKSNDDANNTTLRIRPSKTVNPKISKFATIHIDYNTISGGYAVARMSPTNFLFSPSFPYSGFAVSGFSISNPDGYCDQFFPTLYNSSIPEFIDYAKQFPLPPVGSWLVVNATYPFRYNITRSIQKSDVYLLIPTNGETLKNYYGINSSDNLVRFLLKSYGRAPYSVTENPLGVTIDYDFLPQEIEYYLMQNNASLSTSKITINTTESATYGSYTQIKKAFAGYLETKIRNNDFDWRRIAHINADEIPKYEQVYVGNVPGNVNGFDKAKYNIWKVVEKRVKDEFLNTEAKYVIIKLSTPDLPHVANTDWPTLDQLITNYSISSSKVFRTGPSGNPFQDDSDLYGISISLSYAWFKNPNIYGNVSPTGSKAYYLNGGEFSLATSQSSDLRMNQTTMFAYHPFYVDDSNNYMRKYINRSGAIPETDSIITGSNVLFSINSDSRVLGIKQPGSIFE